MKHLIILLLLQCVGVLCATELHHSLRFDPPNLDFGTQNFGTAKQLRITLFNHANRSVYLSSVSGRTSAFYSSFFEAKVVTSGSNTTFNVVFLPRKHGTVTTDLLIHTSFGISRLLVEGEGRNCPYRLRPIVGVKAPLNATLTPEIHMYNPHKRPLQILEVYSSGGQFQLELPSGGQEGPQKLWEIPPYSTKPIIRIRFHGSTSGNHTAYIRIKISERPDDAKDANENVIVIPVEFEILPQHGLYFENPVVNLGRLTTRDKIHKLKLDFQNSHSRRSHELLNFDLNSIPGVTFDSSDEVLALDPQLFAATRKEEVLDQLLLFRSLSKQNSSKAPQEFSLLLRAEVFRGSLTYLHNATLFVTNSDSYVSGKKRIFAVRNDFEQPLALLRVSVEHNDTKILQIRLCGDYTESALKMVLDPGKSLDLLELQVLDDSANFRTMLQIVTNVTLFEVPVVVCSGRLHVSTNDSGRLLANAEYNVELNLGAVPLAEMSHDGFIILRNRNPLEIKLSTWDFESPQGVYHHTTFMGCLRASALDALNTKAVKIESDSFKFCSHLYEGDVAVFQVAIQSYSTSSEQYEGTLKIWSTYEMITTTVKFMTWMGKLEVDQEQLYFKNCFPGKLCSSHLSIRSTFKHPIHITSINFTDAGLYFVDNNSKGSTIAPNAVTKVGRIYFEPALLCQNRCYIPQDDKTNSIAFPLPHETKGLRNNNLHFDEIELRRRTELFRHLKWYFQTISFTLNSREVRQFQLQLIIDIEWPKLVSGKQVMPTVEIGKVQKMAIVITNPADTPILVDYFLADPKFAQETQLSLPFEVVDISSNCYLTDKAVFSLPEGTMQHPLRVPALDSVSVLVQFEANEADMHCTLLHIRNNLTLYEAVWLTGKTVQSQFRFGNRKPGSSTPLLFEISEKNLGICSQRVQNDADNTHALAITKRTFTARNTGEIPILIEKFLIGDQQCEGYGFKILDCTSFELKANASKKIEIAFSPDFTSTRVSRPLKLLTNLSYEVAYVLLAQLPSVSLDQCSELLPRPLWEKRIQNAAILMLAISFVFVLIFVHIDYGNILLNQSALYISREKGPVHPTFNLRNIAIKTQLATEPCATAAIVTTQQKTSYNSNNIKKRTLKKDFSGSHEMSSLKSATTKNTLTFSERNFKLDTDKFSALGQSNSNFVTNERYVKSATTMTKSIQSEKDSLSCANGKKVQRNVKKTKVGLQTGLEKMEKVENTIQEKPMSDLPSPVSLNVKCDEAKSLVEAGIPDVSSPHIKQLLTCSTKNPTNLTRKHGKTPGRERRKEMNAAMSGEAGNSTASSTSSSSSSSSTTKRSERRLKNKTANALNFETISPGTTCELNSGVMNCISSPWETSSQVSFSDVLQSHVSPVIGNTTAEYYHNDDSKKSVLHGFIKRTELEDAFNTGILDAASKNKDNNGTMELGPIGSKKSPSSTPIWEAVTSSSGPAASIHIPKPTISNNSSFFSTQMQMPNYAYEETVPSVHFELKKTQEELQRQWKANEYILNMRQHQLQTQQHILQGVDAASNWVLNSPTWSPMSYEQSVGNIPATGAAIGSLGPWQSTASVVRPPPGLEGLEANFQINNTSTAQQQQPAPTIESASQPNLEMQNFDPFSSLSSIWSDNWNNNQNQHNNLN